MELHSDLFDMHIEEERLQSFVKWPGDGNDNEFSAILARNGLYYLGRDTKIKCAFCNITIKRFRGNACDFVREHARLSPQCPFRRCRFQVIDSDAKLMTGGGSGGGGGGTRPDPVSMDCLGDYVSEETRLKSFRYWPKSMRQKPEDLAKAGLFYTGIGDRTMCFRCGGCLMDWEENDVPLEEHFRHFKFCPYVLSVRNRILTSSAKK